MEELKLGQMLGAACGFMILLLIVMIVVVLLTIFVQIIIWLSKIILKIGWNVLDCVLFVFGHDECAESRLICDVCKLRNDQIVRYCHECKLYVCSRCYRIHQQFSSCRDHQTFTCKEKGIGHTDVPLSRKHLEEDSVREVEDPKVGMHTVSITKLQRAITLCVCKNVWKSKVHFVNIEANKPEYVLQSHLTQLGNWNFCNFLTVLPNSGCFFIAISGNAIHFIAANVPLLEKLKHFQKIISYQFSKIRYQLTTCAYPPKIEIKENVYKGSSMPTLFTEFNDGVAVLAMKNNRKFRLVPNWSITFYTYEGKFIRKCFLKRSSEGELLFQNPVCMKSTLKNTLIICDSSESDKLVFEVDVDGNILLEVNLKGKVTESITAVTTDGEGNIYVSGQREVLQISENGQKIREMLSNRRYMDYRYISDLCFSENTDKLYVLVAHNRQFTLVSFRFIYLP
ncbi:uncharacterized protein LOC123542848 [Mercenaria mercenaria]|uniref:uncharacterized protein LOC123542848 n=1 Tax=Mercenaria mercenaria TaxID=6596 RepID=UPI00234F81B7|nr:uncharacterized protein LOC123542848 [Mercenaria mercenaria]